MADAAAAGQGFGGTGSYRAALASRDLRLMLAGFAVSAIGSWAYNVALWAWVYAATGSAAWVAAASFARFVPALLLSAYGGVLAERFERTLVMRVCDAIAAAAMGGLAAVALLDAPVALGLVLAAVTSVSAVANDPAVRAMVPQVVGERHLAAANALHGAIESTAVVLGPAIGAGLLLMASTPVAFGVNAATFLASVLLVGRMRARSTPTDVTAGGRTGVLGQVLVGVRALGSTTRIALLAGISITAGFVYGTDTVLFVLLAEDRYGVGGDATGALLAGLGAGGLVGAALVNRLAGRPRLAGTVVAGMVAYCAPTALLAVVADFRVAVALQVVRGAGTMVVDVLAFTALQRALAPELVARAFGAFNMLVLLAVSVGAALTSAALGAVGLSRTLLLLGIGIPLAVAATWPQLQRVDRDAMAEHARLEPRVRLLAGLGIFGAASRGALERLAQAVQVVDVPAGAWLLRQGEAADALHVVTAGTVEVVRADAGGRTRRVATLPAPAYVGEVGLLEGVPRTAGVRAAVPTRVWRIDGAAFLAALADSSPAPAFVETARLRLRTVQEPPSQAPAVRPAI